MAEQIRTAAAPRKQRRWLKTLGWVLGILLVLMVVGYFVGTSSAFFKGMILPRVGKAINSEVTVSDASISPFKSVVLRDLKVQPKGQETLLTAKEVRLRYSLMAIMRGKIDVQEVFVSSPVVNLVENPDGSQNLDPILKSMEEEAEKEEPKAEEPSEPMHLNIQKVTVADGVIRATKLYEGGRRDVMELSPVNVALQDLRNGATGKLTLESALKMDNNPPPPDQPGTLQGAIKGNFDLGLTAEGAPGVIQGKSTFVVTRAAGALAQAADFSTELSCDVTPQQIRQVLVSLQKGQMPLGQLKAAGPLDMNKMEGQIAVELTGVDAKLLNMVGASSGLDFGPTKIFSTNQVQISNTGSVYTVVGRFVVDQLQVTQTNQTTPRLDFSSVYHVTVNQAASTALLRTLDLSGRQNGTPFLEGNLSSPMSIGWGEASQAVSDSVFNLAVTNFNLADWKPFLGESIAGGTINSLTRVSSTKGGKAQTIQGSTTLANLSGTFGETTVTNLGIQVNLDVGIDGDLVRIENIAGTVSQAGQAGGKFETKGTYNLSNEVAQIQGQLRDLNQNVLRTFMEPALGGQQLVSVAINGTFSAGYNPKGASEIKGKMDVANLVVRDPAQNRTLPALTATAQLDAALQNEVAEVRQAQLTLPATDRAKNNSVNLTGRLDMTRTNAMEGKFKLSAETLDLTGYYDIFAGGSTPEESTPAPQGATSSAPGTQGKPPEPEKEPEAMPLPLTNFVAEATIQRLFIREIEITNLHATTKINGGRVQVEPAELSLNGAPMSALVDLDLGVVGWKYALKFQARDVPFAPLVNTYAPERKGQMSGTLTATAALAGRGITEPSLQKNLSGNFDFGTTNLNLAVKNVKSPLLKAIINVIGIFPELRKNPNAALGSLAGAVLGSRGTTGTGGGGWSSELSQSPIQVIEAKATVGEQKLQLERAFLQSPSFEVEAAGVIQLAPVLTNSPLNIPLTVRVERSLAEKINFVPAGTPTNVAYVALPKYVTVKGTVGEPKTDINEAAILGTALEQLGGRIPGVDEKTGKLIQGLGGILTGRKPQTAPTNAPSSTNAPAGQTNAPAAPQTNTSPVGNLLDQFLRKK